MTVTHEQLQAVKGIRKFNELKNYLISLHKQSVSTT